MAEDVRDALLRQLDLAWRLTAHHLDGLTTETCLWRPASEGPHVRRGPDGLWRADWPTHEGYDLGPPSVAWTTWHLGFWWSMAIDHNFADGVLARGDVLWPGSGPAARRWIESLKARWTDRLQALDDVALAAPAARWPFQDRPLGEVFAWANIELTKNAAEIGYGRFLYEVRRR